MDQPANGGISPRRTVHVDDVCAVAKGLARQLPYRAVNLVNFLPAAHHVCLGDEDDIRVAQLADVFARLERIRVHQRGVVPRPPRLRAFVGALDLDVVLPALRIPSEDVEADAAPLEALDRVLGLRLYDLQILLAEDDLQNQLDALRSVLKALRHEVVVHKPEALDLREVFRLHHVCRTPRPRLADDGSGLDHSSRVILPALRHVASSRFPSRGTA